MTRSSQRREMAEKAVARHGVSIALACRAFGVSETCYRYSPKLKDENEEIGDLLVLGPQLRAIAITGLANPEGPAGEGNARPSSRHRVLGHLAALRCPHRVDLFDC